MTWTVIFESSIGDDNMRHDQEEPQSDKESKVELSDKEILVRWGVVGLVIRNIRDLFR